MTDRTSPVNQDWFVPAVLVAVVIALAVIIGIVTGVRSQGRNDNSVARQLERWSSCLRSEGANVPLFESARDGGFRVTVDGSLLSEGLDPDSIGPALDACLDDVPEGIAKIMSALDDPSWLSFGEIGDRTLEFDEMHGIPFDRFREEPRRDDRDRRDIAKRCRHIENGGIDKSDLPPQLLKSCKRSK